MNLEEASNQPWWKIWLAAQQGKKEGAYSTTAQLPLMPLHMALSRWAGDRLSAGAEGRVSLFHAGGCTKGDRDVLEDGVKPGGKAPVSALGAPDVMDGRRFFKAKYGRTHDERQKESSLDRKSVV